MLDIKWTAMGVVLAVALALPAGPTVQAQNPPPWVAVAANETGKVGLAHGGPSREAATSTALSACGHCRPCTAST